MVPSEASAPLIIRSSPRALLGRFAVPVVLLLLGIGVGIYLRVDDTTRGVGNFFLFISAVCGLVLAVRILLAWLRIRHTQYAVHGRQVQESSYLLKFLGAQNNTVKLNEIKQVRCYSNGWLDVWFFDCGKIKMVASGDRVDFVLENIHSPMEVKDQLELRIFGEVAANDPNLRASPAPSA